MIECPTNNFTLCREEDCAWWNYEKNVCSILVISTSLTTITENLRGKE